LNTSDDFGSRVAVLVPAHNESKELMPTLDITLQLRPSDRGLVVADNCTDDTAMIAADANFEVVSATTRPDGARIRA